MGEKQVAVNNKGYLINFDDWDENFAKTMSEIDHLKLTDCHWEAINFLRDFYREYEVPPHPRSVIKAIGDKISSWGCTKKDFEKAFPLGGCKQACRLAGLPLHYCHSC
ncbi:MAG: TusE/DsrC/DsvC family sulfur relay protein [gamma proteobacterium symbiont of Taylorina sp.]|nr:TusE/DsrC/DsvC family sulfur relay protein [gamma proteobacterium symbiont of Taylorina sp.]